MNLSVWRLPCGDITGVLSCSGSHPGCNPPCSGKRHHRRLHSGRADPTRMSLLKNRRKWFCLHTLVGILREKRTFSKYNLYPRNVFIGARLTAFMTKVPINIFPVFHQMPRGFGNIACNCLAIVAPHHRNSTKEWISAESYRCNTVIKLTLLSFEFE